MLLLLVSLITVNLASLIYIHHLHKTQRVDRLILHEYNQARELLKAAIQEKANEIIVQSDLAEAKTRMRSIQQDLQDKPWDLPFLQEMDNRLHNTLIRIHTTG
jgi:Tfp pilus assembly protein PilO